MYIDPTSGGLIFQILAVFFGLISGTVLIFSSRIKMGLAKLRRRDRLGSKNRSRRHHRLRDCPPPDSLPHLARVTGCHRTARQCTATPGGADRRNRRVYSSVGLDCLRAVWQKHKTISHSQHATCKKILSLL
jgi:hypothetical protein